MCSYVMLPEYTSRNNYSKGDTILQSTRHTHVYDTYKNDNEN